MGSIASKCVCNPKSGESQGIKLQGKVIMKLENARRLSRDGLVELSKLSGHPNYIPQLAEWAAVDRYEDDEVHVFSYRHKGGDFSSTDDLGDRYLSANFGWALDYLDNIDDGNAIGWIDILCTCHDEETLMDAFGYMGSLYLENKVANNYMTSPQTFAEVQKRGWIYQESAFPAIDVQSCGWNDEAWGDITQYRIVADLILRRGFQGYIKIKALDLKVCEAQLYGIVKKGKAKNLRNDTSQKWWSDVENYIAMICDPDGLGIVLDLHGLHKLSLQVQTNEKSLNIPSEIGVKLQKFTEKCYKDIVAELKASLKYQATQSQLGYFAVGAIKAFLSSELAVETDRHSAIFGVLKVLSNYTYLPSDDQEGEDEAILKFIWTLAYPKGEIIASPVRTATNCLAGLGQVKAVLGESITPHIPHLSTFVPDLSKSDGTNLYIGKKVIHQGDGNGDMEFGVEIYADKTMNVRAIRIIPKSYWNYEDVICRVPSTGAIHIFE